jgi:hypothetical protein
MDIAQAIKDYGFPIVAAVGMGYFIYFIWKWVTETIDPVIGETMVTLIKLVDRVRMLDNDMIRLNSKLSIVLEHRGMDKEVAQNQTKNEKFNTSGEEDDIKEDPKPNSFGVTPNTK